MGLTLEADMEERAEDKGERQVVDDDWIRAQAECLVNRWRCVSYGIEPEAVLEAGMAATLQFLKAFKQHGRHELVMASIARFARSARELTE